MEEAELQALKKGKVSLAHALHKLDLVGASFTRLQDLERIVATQEAAVDEVKGMLKYFVSSAGLKAALDQFSHDLHNSLNSRFAAFKDSVERQLEIRPEQTAVDEALSTKASSSAMVTLQEQVRSLRGQFETLSSSVFESFKIEVKRSLALKLDAGMLRDTVKDVVDSEEWKRLIARVDAAEARITELPKLIPPPPPPPLEPVEFADTMQMFPDPESPTYKLIHVDSPLQSPGKSPGLSPRSQSSRASLAADWGKMMAALQQDVTECRSELHTLRHETEDRITELEAERNRLRATTRELESVKRKLTALEDKAESMAVPQQLPEATPPQHYERVRSDQDPLIKRVVKLETDVNSLVSTTNYQKTRDKEKFNEFVKSIHYLNDQREAMSRDLTALRTQTTENDLKQSQALSSLKEELLTLRGPMLDMLTTQARESGALNTEIKRHQELFRTLVSEYSASPSLKGSQMLATQKVEFQPRVQSASPGLRLRKKLNTLMTPRKRDEPQPFARPKPPDRNLSASQRSTPRRILDVEKSLALI